PERSQGESEAGGAHRARREDAGSVSRRSEHRAGDVRVGRDRRLPRGTIPMIEWSEQHQVIRDMVRRFVEAEIKPRLEELEHGDTPPYDVLRKMMQAFGIDEVQRQRFQHQIEHEKAGEAKRTAESRSADDIGM